MTFEAIAQMEQGRPAVWDANLCYSYISIKEENINDEKFLIEHGNPY